MARKKAAPTAAQQRLLRFPPTQTTWVCNADVLRNQQPAKCGMYNRGSLTACSCCGKRKPQKPKLLYPLYLKACEQAGIEPGDRWPVREEPAEDTPEPSRPVRRKGVR